MSRKADLLGRLADAVDLVDRNAYGMRMPARASTSFINPLSRNVTACSTVVPGTPMASRNRAASTTVGSRASRPGRCFVPATRPAPCGSLRPHRPTTRSGCTRPAHGERSRAAHRVLIADPDHARTHFRQATREQRHLSRIARAEEQHVTRRTSPTLQPDLANDLGEGALDRGRLSARTMTNPSPSYVPVGGSPGAGRPASTMSSRIQADFVEPVRGDDGAPLALGTEVCGAHRVASLGWRKTVVTRGAPTRIHVHVVGVRHGHRHELRPGGRAPTRRWRDPSGAGTTHVRQPRLQAQRCDGVGGDPHVGVLGPATSPREQDARLDPWVPPARREESGDSDRWSTRPAGHRSPRCQTSARRRS